MGKPEPAGLRSTAGAVLNRQPLFWIVREDNGARSVFLQAATAKIFALIRSAIAGHRGKLAEIHELDAKMVRRVPKKLIGRVLRLSEATALLKRLA
jgi:hypothetical protein